MSIPITPQSFINKSKYVSYASIIVKLKAKSILIFKQCFTTHVIWRHTALSFICNNNANTCFYHF